jgi:hypothetical protein
MEAEWAGGVSTTGIDEYGSVGGKSIDILSSSGGAIGKARESAMIGLGGRSTLVPLLGVGLLVTMSNSFTFAPRGGLYVALDGARAVARTIDDEASGSSGDDDREADGTFSALGD